MRHKGKINNLVKDRKFGFINIEPIGDVFFHEDGLSGLDFDVLNVGDDVHFEVEYSPKGPRAINVRLDG